MNKHSLIDYFGCILFKVCGPLIRFLPVDFSFYLGRKLGDLIYFLDFKHRAIVYSNLKTVFEAKFSPKELKKLTKDFYRAFGQNFIEIFLIPKIDKEYFDRYLKIDGMGNLQEAFKKGKGVLLVAMHEGSWELSNIITTNLGFSFNLLILDQKYPRLNRLLNAYRSQKGCNIIQRNNQTRQLIEVLRSNQALGLMVDQGGKAGILVRFFGKEASMSTGAVKLALKYDAALVPVFYTRVKGPHVKIIIEPALNMQKTGDLEKDIHHNLQKLIDIFEKYVYKYPQEYLWSYKVWKYAKEKRILILSDGKTGHLRQSQALVGIVTYFFQSKGTKALIDTLEVKYKNKSSLRKLDLCGVFSGKYSCQGCLFCLRKYLDEGTYKLLLGKKPDMIISCGSSLAIVNYILSRENLAKSIVLMKPSIFSARRFDLVVMPSHDDPSQRKNVVVTEGALNLIDNDYLSRQSEQLIKDTGIRIADKSFFIGLLIGGDAKNFILGEKTVSEVIKQVKSVAESLNAEILVTTSRRTSKQIEDLLKKELQDYPRCRLFVVANEKNLSSAVGGILGLSSIVVSSPESISMISEAANSNKYVVVFKAGRLKPRHEKFLKGFTRNKYIYLVEPVSLKDTINQLWLNKPQIFTLKDNLIIQKAISRII